MSGPVVASAAFAANGSRKEDVRDCVIVSSAVEGRAFSCDEGLVSLWLVVESR